MAISGPDTKAHKSAGRAGGTGSCRSSAPPSASSAALSCPSPRPVANHERQSCMTDWSTKAIWGSLPQNEEAAE
ncbi:Hypothetical protein GbCGDNIH9_8426 [Granulibacter bethesdensis]|uniref:Uncharacterized protein n=1 Tax=Granulibacter bethesdensis TaxID=364410 RepID=A0AAC9KA05_9PROT|nr:Hypothetical protein GbCGDNIH9_8426 [Granulibacter bethesdensis]APH61423.1 Hypothetical protein GbCGDNIH8_8426 [Granulibacter bethesdensis]